MTKEFYSNGKLLLSGEYAILDGAEGWAIPTKFGQYLRIETNTTGKLQWKSIDANGRVWFEATYGLASLKEISSTNKAVSQNLFKIITEAKILNPKFLGDAEGYSIETELTFPKDWGLGSSSTLINNMSNWANIDPYSLLSKTFGGSGYDIACAQHNKPILFKIEDGSRKVQEINLLPPFNDSLFFIYLNQKKNSREAISMYRKLTIRKDELIKSISQITQRMVKSQHLEDFEDLINRHEAILSKVLRIPTIKEQLFSDYSGSIKSLGGWGGDFILATGNKDTINYFENKGYKTILTYPEMAL